MRTLSREEAAAKGFIEIPCGHCGAMIYDRYTAEGVGWIGKAGGVSECLPCTKKYMEPELLLYWGSAWEQRGNATGKFIEGLFALFTGKAPNIQPQDCVRSGIPRADREDLARALARGTMKESYFGYAHCRICGLELGNKDLVGWGWQWPEKAEHYVLMHDVWTPACTRLLAQVRTT